MAPYAGWMSMVKEEVKKSPLASNFCFGLLLFCVEKIVEMEFACPCNQQWLNHLTVSSFFILPTLTIYCLLVYIQTHMFEKLWMAFMHSLVPAILWIVLLLFDGRYIACANTSWTGKYELIENSGSQRWCKPFNSNKNSVTDTQRWYSISQMIGQWMALVLAVSYVIFLGCSQNSMEEPSKPKPPKEKDEASESVHITLISNKNTSSKFAVAGSLEVVSE